MPGNMRNSLKNLKVFYFLIIGNFLNAYLFGKFREFPKCLGIWEIPPIPRNLGNFPNAWESGKFTGKFPKYLGIWGIPQIYRNLDNSPIFLRILEWFPKCLGIWEIPKTPGNLGNSSNSWVKIIVVVRHYDLRSLFSREKYFDCLHQVKDVNK